MFSVHLFNAYTNVMNVPFHNQTSVPPWKSIKKLKEENSKMETKEMNKMTPQSHFDNR